MFTKLLLVSLLFFAPAPLLKPEKPPCKSDLYGVWVLENVCNARWRMTLTPDGRYSATPIFASSSWTGTWTFDPSTLTLTVTETRDADGPFITYDVVFSKSGGTVTGLGPSYKVYRQKD